MTLTLPLKTRRTISSSSLVAPPPAVSFDEVEPVGDGEGGGSTGPGGDRSVLPNDEDPLPRPDEPPPTRYILSILTVALEKMADRAVRKTCEDVR